MAGYVSPTIFARDKFGDLRMFVISRNAVAVS
jgi:hypothetical protein